MYTDQMKHVSASQFKTYGMCKRKWVLDRSDDRGSQSSPAAEFGKLLHTVFEAALVTGDTRAFAEYECLSELEWIHELCAATVSPEQVECKIYLDEFAIPVLGYIDLVLHDGDVVTIVDHKTSGSWSYVLKPEALRVDPQAIIYTYAMLTVYPEVQTFRFRHHCVRTKGKPVKERIVEVEYTRAEVEAHRGVIAARIAEMCETHESGVAMDIEGAYDNACYAFGGCAYKARCYAARGAEGYESMFDPEPILNKITVYRDCLPASGVQPVPWGVLTAPLHTEYTQKNAVVSYLLVPYGEGTRAMAVATMAAIKSGKLAVPEGGIAIDGADPAAALFCTMLDENFVLIRGLR